MKPPIPNEREATLRDGRVCRVRPISPEDCGRLVEFHERLSVNTTRLRFFSPLRHLSPEFAKRLCNVDFKRRCAFVISLPGDDAIHAVGRYEWESAHSAEVAFVVEDQMQGLGIGAILLDRLADHARTRGFRRLTAVVLCENTMMLSLFRESKYLPEIHMEGSMAFVKLDIRRKSQPRGRGPFDKVA
ncbi:MAG: N-acetyltransferase family protein [Dehalococcoidia bacterium]